MRPRFCGILLHISSLPSAYGIGDLGPAAHAFVQNIASRGISHWQFLPLSPTSTGIGNSPYSSPSAFAGNPLFISPELLLTDGAITHADLDSAMAATPDGHLEHDENHVDYTAVSAHRETLLRLAHERNSPYLKERVVFTTFCKRHAHWLHDYARFMSIKEKFHGDSWIKWPDHLKNREADAMLQWDVREAHDMERHKYIQFLFFKQWRMLKDTCGTNKIHLVGDLPIYVTHDSVDVWANRDLFDLDEHGNPNNISGVPPDYFSPTGQRWGNPVYRWEAMKNDDFSWWNRRLNQNFLLADMVRMDHFRGFCGYWEIAAHEPTAINGCWKDAPGQALFASFLRNRGILPIIAEDLGIITPDVRELMYDFNLPGMKVLQFAFAGDPLQNPHVPFQHKANNVVYTGTHDNPTTKEWFSCATQEERHNLQEYTGSSVNEGNAHDILMRLALSSPAELAVIPMQDILGLGYEARMNTPSTTQNNWSWRMRPSEANPERLNWLQAMCRLYGR